LAFNDCFFDSKLWSTKKIRCITKNYKIFFIICSSLFWWLMKWIQHTIPHKTVNIRLFSTKVEEEVREKIIRYRLCWNPKRRRKRKVLMRFTEKQCRNIIMRFEKKPDDDFLEDDKWSQQNNLHELIIENSGAFIRKDNVWKQFFKILL